MKKQTTLKNLVFVPSENGTFTLPNTLALFAEARPSSVIPIVFNEIAADDSFLWKLMERGCQFKTFLEDVKIAKIKTLIIAPMKTVRKLQKIFHREQNVYVRRLKIKSNELPIRCQTNVENNYHVITAVSPVFY